MQSAQRDASNRRRMPMRARSRDEHVARTDLIGFTGPRWCAVMLSALADRTERESHGATPATVPANGRFLLRPYRRSGRSVLHVA